MRSTALINEVVCHVDANQTSNQDPKAARDFLAGSAAVMKLYTKRVKREGLEVKGIEPSTSRMRSERSAPELHPRLPTVDVEVAATTT